MTKAEKTVLTESLAQKFHPLTQSLPGKFPLIYLVGYEVRYTPEETKLFSSIPDAQQYRQLWDQQLTELSNTSPKEASQIKTTIQWAVQAGINTIEQLAQLSPEELEQLPHIGPNRANFLHQLFHRRDQLD